MNRTRIIITVTQALRWLGKQRKTTRYSFYNHGRGCLFSRIAKSITKDQSITVNISQLFSGDTSSGVVPFHDEFWKRLGVGRTVITQPKAIEILKKMRTEEKNGMNTWATH